MSVTNIEPNGSRRLESIPSPWESLEQYIDRVLVGPSRYRRQPKYDPDLPVLRVGWLDSARVPSRIHATQDGSVTTICQHAPLNNHHDGRWVIVEEVPRKRYGVSRYCRICFSFAKKTVPWLDPKRLKAGT